MHPAQNRFWRAFFAFGSAVALFCTGATAGLHGKLTETFNCGLKPRYCSPESNDPCLRPDPIFVAVLRDGSIVWNGARVDERTFSAYLTDAVQSNPQPVFVIEAAYDTPYGKVAALVLKMQNANIQRMMCSAPGTND